MSEAFAQLLGILGAAVWGPHTTLLLLGVGLYLSLRLRFAQLRHLGLTLRLLVRGGSYGDSLEGARGDVSPVQALTTSLAATIGNGNIAGVCTAIAMGGPGAVFWMWLSALLGMATKIAEAVLGQRFRQTAEDGSVSGGPMYYLSVGLGMPWMAAVFAFFMGGKALFATTLVQSNSIAIALEAQVGLPGWVSGLGVAVLVWLVIIGGIRSIARVTLLLSPAMVALYVAGALVTVALHAGRIPQALELILRGAFDPAAVGGGVASPPRVRRNK